MKNKPLRILFDATPVANAGKSGVGHYTGYLVQALAAKYPQDVQLIGHYYNFLGRKRPDLPKAPNISYRPTYLFPGKVTNALRRFGFKIPFEILCKTRGDILLFPNFLALPSLFRKPTVVTIHDLCFLAFPDFVSDRNLHDLQKYVPQSVANAKLVLTISEFTKHALEDAYQIDPADILITPIPPFDKHTISDSQAEALTKKLGITKRYLLFVGNLEPRKNLGALVEAYVKLPQKIRDEYSLLLVGGKGWKSEALFTRIDELQRQGFDIKLPGYVSDDEKAALYQRASLVVLPSHYEGFGMPVLEAFQYDVPVALSDIPVLHEVAGSAATYFDQNDPGDIAKKLAEALERTPTAEDRKLRQKVLRQASWEDNARVVYEALRGVAL